MSLKKYRCVILWYILLVFLGRRGACDAITNAQFNASLRDYSIQEDNTTTNTSDVRTLQKEYERYSSVVPITSHIRFKEVPDSVLSPSLSHSRGLLQHGHHGYGIVDYEEHPQYGYEYHIQDDHSQFDDHHHHLDHHHGHHFHHDDHNHGYGHRYKHYDHALAAKTVLWPIAGLALLGAAAALVSNPVLLQLGVISGRRRRRNANDNTDKLPDFPKPDYPRFSEKHAMSKPIHFKYDNRGNTIKTINNKPTADVIKKEVLIKDAVKHNRRLSRRINPKVKTSIRTLEHSKYDTESHEKLYIPILLKTKD